MRHYPTHLKRTVDRCGYLALASTRASENHNTIHLSHSKCKSYSCEICRKRNLKILRGRIFQATAQGTWRFATLTIPVGRTPTQEQYAALANTWRLFCVRLRQAYPKIKYIKVLDTGTGGNCHYHMLCNEYIARDWLLQTWTACGGGYIVDIRLIPGKAAATYVSKYISSLKQLRSNIERVVFEANLRRFSASSNTMPNYDKRASTLLLRCYSMKTLLEFILSELWFKADKPLYIPIASCYSPP